MIVRLTVPLPDTEWAALEVPRPMTEANWRLMLAILDAFKPGIVEPDQVAEKSESSDSRALGDGS